jgi:hypothetical protein
MVREPDLRVKPLVFIRAPIVLVLVLVLAFLLEIAPRRGFEDDDESEDEKENRGAP